jgi:hypothetical protein
MPGCRRKQRPIEVRPRPCRGSLRPRLEAGARRAARDEAIVKRPRPGPWSARPSGRSDQLENLAPDLVATWPGFFAPCPLASPPMPRPTTPPSTQPRIDFSGPTTHSGPTILSAASACSTSDRPAVPHVLVVKPSVARGPGPHLGSPGPESRRQRSQGRRRGRSPRPRRTPSCSRPGPAGRL